MSNFKGTQGKWILSGSDKTFVYALNESGTNSFSLNINNDGKTDIEEQQANALLISKAPEMIEMLRKLYANDLLKDNQNEVLELIKEATEL